MLFAVKDIHALDLIQAKELKFQLSELRYHLENVHSSIKEAVFHLKKSRQHDSVIKELNKTFNI